jgi:hypothetical protein
MKTTQKKAAHLMKSWTSVKQNIKHFIQKGPLVKMSNTLNKKVKDLQHDIESFLPKDARHLKQTFLKEKKDIEKLFDKVILGEMKKAQKYVDKQRKEFSGLQKKIEKLVGKKTKKSKKSAVRKTVRKAKATTASTHKTSTKKTV